MRNHALIVGALLAVVSTGWPRGIEAVAADGGEWTPAGVRQGFAPEKEPLEGKAATNLLVDSQFAPRAADDLCFRIDGKLRSDLKVVLVSQNWRLWLETFIGAHGNDVLIDGVLRCG